MGNDEFFFLFFMTFHDMKKKIKYYQNLFNTFVDYTFVKNIKNKYLTWLYFILVLKGYNNLVF